MIPTPSDFDSILDECLLEITTGQSSVEDCLKRHPQVATQLAPLLRTAARVSRIPRSPELTAEKRRAIEQQLLSRAVQSKAAASPRPSPSPARRSLRFGLLAVIIVALLFVGGSGLVTASSTSLPTDWLYPLKRLTEQAALSATSGAAQINLHIDWARRRLDEFEVLAARSDVRPELMNEAVRELDAALQSAIALPDDQRQQVVAAVLRLTDVQTTLAANIPATAPLATRASLENTTAAAATTRQRALQLAGQPPTTTSLTATAPAAPSTPTSTGTAGLVPTSTVIPPTATIISSTVTLPANPTTPGVKPTDRPTKTPRPPITPPGLVKTPNTPPGQVDKTPKPNDPPPGQVKTPKPKK